MSPWDNYPADYRAAEVAAILKAVRAGECVAVLGLSGAGKSNLLGFLAHRRSTAAHPLALVDCNRLLDGTPAALFQLARHVLGRFGPAGSDPLVELRALSDVLAERLQEADTLTLLFDRFELFTDPPNRPLLNSLRALRDEHKYRLSYVIAARRPLPANNELAELFHAHTLWLGPLSESDARRNVTRYAARQGEVWDEAAIAAILAVSRAYPSLLRAACEAYANGAAPDALARHPAIQARVAEFWSDEPDAEHLERSRLADHPVLRQGRGPIVDESELTAKEQLLYDYFQAHPDEVCEKDDLIRAVWPEDAIYEEGIRDSSLAQLVRRLRVKIEPDPAEPRFIHTVPGRGYLYKPA